MPPGGGSPASRTARSIPTAISSPAPTNTAKVLRRVASGSSSTTAPMPGLRMEPPSVGTRNPAHGAKKRVWISDLGPVELPDNSPQPSLFADPPADGQ